MPPLDRRAGRLVALVLAAGLLVSTSACAHDRRDDEAAVLARTCASIVERVLSSPDGGEDGRDDRRRSRLLDEAALVRDPAAYYRDLDHVLSSRRFGEHAARDATIPNVLAFRRSCGLALRREPPVIGDGG